MAHQQEFVGIDVSKLGLDVAIWPSGEMFSVANDRDGRADLVRRLKRRSVDVIGLEASGGYERAMLKALLDAGLPGRRVNPLRVRQFASACGILAKNDQLDALVIARFVATLPQHPVERDPAVEKLAELVTARRQLCDELTRVNNQAEHATQPIIQRLGTRRANRLKLEIVALDKAIAQAVLADHQLARKNALLRSVPCVGPVFAHSLLALMPELGTLSNRKVASLLGVAPFDYQSGSFKGQRHIFGGRQAIRDVAYMAAMVGGSCNPTLSVFRERLLAAGKPPKVVIVALMRKLITILNAVIREQRPWTPA
jgi:transposase